MARYRKIDPKLHGDAKFRSLSAPNPNAQSLWLYLLTNPETTSLPGLYRAGKAGLAEALGWSLKDFEKCFVEIEAQGMAEADWDARLVWVPNAIRYESPANQNVVKGWVKLWDDLPECKLRAEAHKQLLAHLEGLGELFAEPFRELFPGWRETVTGTDPETTLLTGTGAGALAGAVTFEKPSPPSGGVLSDVQLQRFNLWYDLYPKKNSTGGCRKALEHSQARRRPVA